MKTYILTRKDVEVLVEAIGGDGHSLVSPEYLIGEGVAEEFVRNYARVHKSDGSPKGSISVGGKIVEKFDGVHTLKILEGACRALGLPRAIAIGRGFRAREVTTYLKHWLQHND